MFCTPLELFCRAHEWECALLLVVWKNELPFLFVVCLLSASPFAERGDEACIDHSVSVIPQLCKVTVSPWSAQERSRHAGCFYTVTAPESVGFNRKICFCAVWSRHCVPEECWALSFPVSLPFSQAMTLSTAVLLPDLRHTSEALYFPILFTRQPFGNTNGEHSTGSIQNFQKSHHMPLRGLWFGESRIMFFQSP